jgi:hypothetical protein
MLKLIRMRAERFRHLTTYFPVAHPICANSPSPIGENAPFGQHRCIFRLCGLISAFDHPHEARSRPKAMEKLIGRSSRAHINFGVPAALRKWPSFRNARREGTTPYLLFDGTPDQCIRALMAKPAALRHLYEIHISPQPPLVDHVLPGEQLTELARLRDFL